MKVKGPLMSINASGKIGERLVFSRRGSGQQARFQKAQKDVSSSDRVTARSNYVSAVSAWNALSDSQKEAYKILAISENISGYNYFIRNYLNNLPMNATGGVITYDGDYRIHTFNSASDFVVLRGGLAEVLIVAGGGGTSWIFGGIVAGAGGGGVIPLSDYEFTVGSFPVVVGAGGVSGATIGSLGGNGSDSLFLGYVVKGGGKGGDTVNEHGLVGGSGGGAARNSGVGASGTLGQGNKGGDSSSSLTGAGGGGKGGAGGNGTSTSAGNGGLGYSSSISGAVVTYGGGGGGGANTFFASVGVGNGGGGNGGGYQQAGQGGANGRGGGAGGNCFQPTSTPNGGHGVVIVRYKYR